jgi:hypothetical protein
VLGILALLSLFALSFASVTRIERVASQNALDAVRAELAARAGIAAGVAGAHQAFRQPSPSIPALGGYLDGVHEILGQTEASITLGSVVGIAAGDTLVLRGGSSPDEAVTVAPGYVPGTNPVPLTSAPAAGRLHAIPPGASWYYHGHTRNPATTGNGVPLAIALPVGPGAIAAAFGVGMPSFPIATGPTLASSVSQVSGSTGGTYFTDPAPAAGNLYVAGGDVYGVKVLDALGMLDANMSATDLVSVLPAFGADVLDELTQLSAAIAPSLPPPPAPPINAFLPLSDASGRPYPQPFDPVLFARNPQRFVEHRSRLPGGVFRSKEQLRGAFEAIAPSAAVGEAWFTLYADYFATWGERDPGACQGDDLGGPASSGQPGAWDPPGGIPLDASGAPDARRIFQTATRSGADFPARRAVDINTAPYPVLVAVLSTCRARGLPSPVADPNAEPLATALSPGAIAPMAPYPTQGNGAVTYVQRADAQAIAAAICKHRPFRAWNDVYRCLDTLHGGSVSDPVLAAALVATCPVDLPLGLNPDRSLLYWDTVTESGASIDPDDPNGPAGFAVAAEKAGSYACADFCFTSGTFEVQAIGRIYANPTTPTILATCERRTVVDVGGVAWVRGENDLASQLATNPANAGLMGGPALLPASDHVGGWVQPRPGESGLAIPRGASVAPSGSSLTSWTPNTADGLLVERASWTRTRSSVLVVHADASPSFALDQGTAELWVKEPFPSSQGTNESLFMNLRDYPVGLRHSEQDLSLGEAAAALGGSLGGGDAADLVVTQLGTATQLERYGDVLFLARSLWGFPDGASAPALGELQASPPGTVATAANPLTDYGSSARAYIASRPLRWQAGTWHHVFLSWDALNLSLFVDGQDMGAPVVGPGSRGEAVLEKLRAHLPLAPPASSDPAAEEEWARRGPTESYFLGATAPGSYGTPAEPPLELATLGFSLGDPAKTPSRYARYANGTFDALRWQQTASLSGPPVTPHRYRLDPAGTNGTYALTVVLPPGWIPVAHGYHVIVDHDLFPASTIATANGDLGGGGRTDGMTVTPTPMGASVVLTKTFPATRSTRCNVALHLVGAVSCTIPGSNEVPWAIGGAWIAYEKPTTVLESEDVDER